MIQIENIFFGYGTKLVLKDLSMSLGGGQVCGLLGLNGEGKTTLMKILAGLNRPDCGTVSVNGFKPFDRQPAFLGDVYLMPEEVRPLPMPLRKLAAHMSKFYPRFSYETFGRLLEYFDIDVNAPLSSMSMGQVKKAHTCLAFASQTRLMLLDEPTNGLDIPSKMQWRRVVAECMDESRSIIISSHQVKDIENMLDRVAILSQGRIVFNHTLSEVGERLAFDDVMNGEELAGEIYSAPSAKGRKVISVQSQEDQESLVDLEMLFAAVLANPAEVEKAINR